MQHGEETDLGAQVLRIGCNDAQGFRCGVEENTVDDFLVLVSDGGDLLRHSKDHVKVGDLQEFGLAVLDPLRPCQRLTLWAMPIATGVEAIPLMAASIAAFQVPTQRRCAAHLDGGHHAPLLPGHRRAMLIAIGLAVAAEHIRHFQPGTVHRLATQKC